MNKFACIGFRPVNSETMSAAAEIFAKRLARREFGRRGIVRTCQIDVWHSGGQWGDYVAFIGKPGPDPAQTTGGDVRLHVYMIG